MLPPVKSNTFKMLLKYLRGDKCFYRLPCSTTTATTFCVISVKFLQYHRCKSHNHQYCTSYCQHHMHVLAAILLSICINIMPKEVAFGKLWLNLNPSLVQLQRSGVTCCRQYQILRLRCLVNIHGDHCQAKIGVSNNCDGTNHCSTTILSIWP